MGSMVSGLADAVLGVVEGLGLSSDTVARYRQVLRNGRGVL